MFDKASENYNDFLEIYYYEYYGLADDKGKEQSPKFNLKIYFLINMIIVCGQKIKKNLLIKKNLKIYYPCHYQKLIKKRKLEPEETIAERVKLNPQKRKRKNEKTGLKILTPNKLLTRLPI